MLLRRDPEKAAATLEQLKGYVLEVMATKVIRGGNGCSREYPPMYLEGEIDRSARKAQHLLCSGPCRSDCVRDRKSGE